MNKKQIYIIQADGKDFINNDFVIKSFKRYKVAFDFSLDLMQIRKIHKEHFSHKENFFKNTKNKNDKKIYSDILVSVTFKYKTDTMNTEEIRETLYRDGFYIGDKHYVRFKRSSGSSRVGKCLFILEEYYNHIMEYSYMGLDFSDPNQEVDLASLEAYISLTTSSIIDTIQIKTNEILVIDDFNSIFNDKVVVTKNINGKLYTEKSEIEISNSIFDGQSLLDKSVFDNSEYKDKGMLLLRNRFFKSCCFNTNVQQFFKDNNITKISQLNGYTKARKIEQIKLITTPSSIKYLKFGNLKDFIKKTDKMFGIVKYEKGTHYFENNLVKTHYQLLNTLEFTREKMEEFLQQTFDYIKLLKNMPSVVRYHLKMTLDNLEEQEKYYDLSTSLQFIQTMLGISDDISKTNIYKSFVKNTIKNLVNDCRAGHILVNGNYSTLFGNGMEMLLHSIGKFDGNSILNKDEVISYRFQENETILGSRSPHITMGNVWLMKNVRNENIEKYFNLTKEIILVNAIKNNLLERLSGSDYDSDTVLLTNNKILIELAEKNYNEFLVPTSKVNASKTKRYNTTRQKTDLDKKTSINKIGEIVNLSQVLNSLLWELKKENKDYEDVYLDIAKLSVMSNIAIDMAKKEFDINLEAELNELREKYSIYVKNKPLFFYTLPVPDRFKKSKDKYMEYETSMDYLVKSFETVGNKTKKNREDTLDIIDLFHLNSSNSRIRTYHIAQIIELISEYKAKCNLIWTSTSLNNSEKYFKCVDLKIELIETIKKMKINAKTIYRIIQSCDKKKQRAIIGLLFEAKKEEFIELINQQKQKVDLLEINENGDFEIFGVKFLQK